MDGLISSRFTWNQLWNEGVGEFFWEGESLLQGVEYLDRTLAEVERVKAHRGEGWPDIFAERGIIGANKGHFLWHPYTEARQRTEQDRRVLVAKGVDARWTVRAQQEGLDQRKSGRGREV